MGSGAYEAASAQELHLQRQIYRSMKKERMTSPGKADLNPTALQRSRCAKKKCAVAF